MKYGLIGILLGFIAMTAPAFAKDPNCSVGYGEFGELQFSLPSDKALYKTLHQKKIKKNSVVETAVLKNGTRVKITQGGCTHYTMEFQFRSWAQLPSGSLVDQAVALLKTLPTEENSQMSLLMSELLDSQKDHVAQDVDFKCGSGTCALSSKPKVFTIVYDFPV